MSNIGKYEIIPNIAKTQTHDLYIESTPFIPEAGSHRTIFIDWKQNKKAEDQKESNVFGRLVQSIPTIVIDISDPCAQITY